MTLINNLVTDFSNLKIDTSEEDKNQTQEIKNKKSPVSIYHRFHFRKLTGKNQGCKKYVENLGKNNLANKNFEPKTISIIRSQSTTHKRQYQIDRGKLIELERNFFGRINNSGKKPHVRIYDLASGKLKLEQELTEQELTEQCRTEYCATQYSNGKVITYGEVQEENCTNKDFLRVDFLGEVEKSITIEMPHKSSSWFNTIFEPNIVEWEDGQILTLSSSAKIVQWNLKAQTSKIIFDCKPSWIFPGLQQLLRTQEGYLVASSGNVIAIFSDLTKKPFVQKEKHTIYPISIDGNRLAYSQSGHLPDRAEEIKILNILNGEMICSLLLNDKNKQKYPTTNLCLHKEYIYVLRKLGHISRINWREKSNEILIHQIDVYPYLSSMRICGGLLFVSCGNGEENMAVVIDLKSHKCIKEITGLYREGYFKPLILENKMHIFEKIVELNFSNDKELLCKDYLVQKIIKDTN